MHDEHLNPCNIKLNDKVMLRNEARHKHEPMFKGPYIVIGIDEPNAIIKDENSNKTRTVHKNNLNIFKT